MKRLIEDALIKCGATVRGKGFQNTVEAVSILVNEPDLKISALYEIIANRTGTKWSGIERNIRYSLKQMAKYGEGELIRFYLGNVLTNAECLRMLAFRIRRELEDRENEVHGK